LCILDANAIPDIRNYPPKFSNLPKLIKNEIDLPGSCDVKSLPPWGLSSVSWSHDGKKIAIVCEQYEGNTVIDSSVCIVLPDGGNGTCWDKTSKSYNHVKRISWSPMSDVLAISANGLFIVDPKGNNATLLKNNGWSPTWSPDGKQIAYFRQGEKQGDYQIVIMNSDGSNEQVLYTPPVSNDYNDTYYRIIPSCEQISGLCRLAWSPDGRYIAFSSDWTENFWVIFRIDIKTGAIIFLTVHQGGKFSEPDWSPLVP
jgi:Tol biopolymer transport system component